MKYRNKKTEQIGEYLGFNKRTGYHTIALEGGGQKSATDSTFKRWWVEVLEDEKSKEVPASSKNKQKKKGTKKMKKLTWEEVVEKFKELNQKVGEKYLADGEPENFEWTSELATVVIDASCFKDELSEEERSYVVHSNSFGFFPWETKPTIVADAPDGGVVKLDQKLKKGWVVEYCYQK